MGVSRCFHLCIIVTDPAQPEKCFATHNCLDLNAFIAALCPSQSINPSVPSLILPFFTQYAITSSACACEYNAVSKFVDRFLPLRYIVQSSPSKCWPLGLS